jgi:hypothetical protein
MEWWQSQPEAWQACRVNAQPPAEVMPRYLKWLKELPGQPVFVGYPVAFDFMFVYWYLIKFAGESPFSHSALDIKTYAMALLKKPYRASVKNNMPRRWFDDLPHTIAPSTMPSNKALCFAICWQKTSVNHHEPY